MPHFKIAITTIRKFLKTLGIIILIFISLIVIYVVLAILLPKISVNKNNIKEADLSIYILTNGVHTDIVVPVKSKQIDWSKIIRFQNTISTDSTFEFLAIGWGDKGFYLDTTWGELKFSTAFKAVFGLSTSAIHATYYKSMQEGADCRKIGISKKQYSQLIQYVQNTLIFDKDGNTINIKTNANYGKNDAFYEAHGHYNLINTCNNWANSGLKSCGQKACLWTPMDKGIFNLYEVKK